MAGVYVAGGMHSWGGGMHGGEWGMHGRRDSLWSRPYASYWNAFLFIENFNFVEFVLVN